LPIFASYGSCAYKNLSAKFKQNILTFSFEIIVWPQKTAKIVSFGNIWSVFHLTTHEKRKTDQNYKKKPYKTLHNTTFFPGMTSVLQTISPDQSKTFLICWPPISMFPIKLYYIPKKLNKMKMKVKFCEHRWVSRTCYVVSETKVPHTP
jgi:hypothetical protein